MKAIIGLFLFLATSMPALAQYYYRDIIVPRQTMQKWSAYKENRVRNVRLSSFEASGKSTPGFDCNQVISDDFSTITTFTKSSLSSPTTLTAYYDNKGLLRKTIDTSDTYQSTTTYDYDELGRVLTIINNALETDNQVSHTESHVWSYRSDGKPAGMIKIMNSGDTTRVNLVLDNKGNVIEEHPVRQGVNLPVVFYYYDSSNSLTDVVRFNEKARRLLPDYIFEKNSRGQMKTMLFLPPGTGEYQKWIYEYYNNGLEKMESCFNKRNELLGKIEYQYDFKRS
jgi:YD repeat-containing protein